MQYIIYITFYQNCKRQKFQLLHSQIPKAVTTTALAELVQNRSFEFDFNLGLDTKKNRSTKHEPSRLSFKQESYQHFLKTSTEK